MVKGETKNYLTMISDPLVGCKKNYPKAWFKCICGKQKIIGVKNVSEGATKSCGCINFSRKGNYRHGGSLKKKTRLYNIYHKMKTRCYSPNYSEAKYYSERGITICEEWKNNFVAFRDWALKNGYAENLSIDRIDVNKGYSPDNCRWVDDKTQSRNRRSNIKITHNGQTKILMEWCEELNLPYATIRTRIVRGWDCEDALTKPIRNAGGKHK